MGRAASPFAVETTPPGVAVAPQAQGKTQPSPDAPIASAVPAGPLPSDAPPTTPVESPDVKTLVPEDAPIVSDGSIAPDGPPDVVCAIAVALRLPSVRSSKAALRIRTALGELREGARYALGQPTLIGMFSLTALQSLLVMPSIQGLMPVYAAEVFGVDSRGLGLMLSAVGAGSTLGTFTLASIGEIRAKGVVTLASTSVVTLAMAVFSVNTLFHTAYLNLMILSAAMMVFFSVSNAIIQSTVSDEYRGRVTGLYMLTWGLFPFGSLIAGFLAEQLGAPHATQIAVGVMVGLFALTMWRIRALRELGRF